MKNLSMIACVGRDNGIGKDGGLLWHIPEDMRFFRETTSGHPVIMGRRTYESIGHPLPQRENIVLTSRPLSGVTTCSDPDALRILLETKSGEKFVIGGAMLYNMYIDQAEKLYLTEVDAVKPADTFFPNFDRSQFTRRIIQSGVHEGIAYEIAEYTRKASASAPSTDT